jgi:hypothetical protein
LDALESMMMLSGHGSWSYEVKARRWWRWRGSWE